jgi:hypothetical protein
MTAALAADPMCAALHLRDRAHDLKIFSAPESRDSRQRNRYRFE